MTALVGLAIGVALSGGRTSSVSLAAVPDTYVYVPIASELAQLGTFTLPSNTPISVEQQHAVTKPYAKYVFSSLDATLAASVGFGSIGVNVSGEYSNAFVDFSHFGLIKQTAKVANVDVPYFIAYGQGSRMRTIVATASLGVDAGALANAIKISAGISVYTAEFDLYGFTKAYPFQVTSNANGTIGGPDALKSLSNAYNAAIADANGAVEDVPLGVWVPQSWTKKTP